MRKISYCLGWISLMLLSLSLSAQVPSPAEFLGYELGSRFSWHHQAVSYYEAVAETSPRVRLQAYGETYEGRPLMVAFVSSEENLDQLEVIRQNNLKATGLASGEIEGPRLPIVWLSYNIHGNEASSTEAAMATLYQLAVHDTANWLDEVVVVLDPCINPDGRDRYINWNKQVSNIPNQVAPQSVEHHEPWPGGRYNHYLFDLNRDWAWQTQQESHQRAQLYQRWLPQVHVDFHEQMPENPYFFAPAAHPMHNVITDWQQEFQELVGRNHASYFDANGWLYFTKEVFDLFYPSYGDTWPTYQGAIGFTYEQGGHGRAGLGYLRETGDTLTLLDRLTHHYTTGLSTVETAYDNRERLLAEFDQFFADGAKGDETFKAYVISQDNPLGKLEGMTDLLDQHQIQYHQLKADLVSSGFDYANGETGSINLKAGDLVVPAAQSQGNLVRVLFEPTPYLEDSLTYDLTAWSLPYAYQLEAYALNRMPATAEEVSLPVMVNEVAPSIAYACLIPWEDMRSARWLAKAHQAGINVRMTQSSFTFEGKNYPRGTLVITRADNSPADVWEQVLRFANEENLGIRFLESGFADQGVDLGSGSVEYLDAPKVALVRGEGVSPSRFGEVWHYFEQQLEYPLHVLDTEYLGRVDLDEYNVLILASGGYGRYTDKFYEFAQHGGRIIALEGAIRSFGSSNNGGQSTILAHSMQQVSVDHENISDDDESLLKRYEDQGKEYATTSIPGSIYKVQLDDSHPLAYGMGDTYFSIKHSSTAYPYLRGGWNVGTYPSGKPLSGFAGVEAQKEIEKTLAIGQESFGRGDLVYIVDSPVFRGFWVGGQLLLANAIFFR